MDERLERLVDLLDDQGGGETVGTSIRFPVELREAAILAAEMGLISSTSEVAARGMRDVLNAYAQRAVLDAHYAQHPEARPDLAEIALATADLDGSQLADQPELVQRAVADLQRIKADPTPDDVLMYAAGLAAAAA